MYASMLMCKMFVLWEVLEYFIMIVKSYKNSSIFQWTKIQIK